MKTESDRQKAEECGMEYFCDDDDEIGDDTMGKWLLNVLISIDQFGNTIMGGDPDETVSSRLGKMKLKYGGQIPWHHPLARLTDIILDKIDSNHSVDAIEPDEGKEGIIEDL